MRSFVKNGFICLVSHDQDKPLEHFAERGNFIVSQKPSTSEAYSKCLKYSRLYTNIKYHKCSYSQEVMKELQLMITNLN